MARINRLTDAQRARVAEFRDRWIEIGLSTEPADRPRAEAAICKMYEIAGLPHPHKIVWCGSPLAQGLTRAIICDRGASVWASVWDSVGASVGASVWASVRDSVMASVGASVWDSVGASVRASVGDSVGASVWDSVRASVGASVWDSVRASVGASVWDSVRASVGASVRASVWDSVWDSVRASVGDSVGDSVMASVGASVWDSVWDSVRASVMASVGDSVWASVYGQHDAGWLSFYDYFRDALGLRAETQMLEGLSELAQSAGWALPHAGICWVSERHQVLERDERGRLHCLTGPAVLYPDGWAIYAIHGVRVPAEIVERPETITADRIRAERNAEVRRVMLDRFGAARYVEAIGAACVQKDSAGELYRAEIPDDEPMVMVKVRNATPEPDGSVRDYWLRVPPNTKTARAGVAWTFGLRPSEYRPAIET